MFAEDKRLAETQAEAEGREILRQNPQRFVSDNIL